MNSDLLHHKTTHYAVWRPRITAPPPELVIGKLQHGNPQTFVQEQLNDLAESRIQEGYSVIAIEPDGTNDDFQIYEEFSSSNVWLEPQSS